MIAAVYLLTLAVMSFLGCLATASKTRAFWLGWRRIGRKHRRLTGGSVDLAWRYWDKRHGIRWARMELTKHSAGWMHRSTSRLCRYYAGIPVFKNRVFTLP